MSIVFRIDEQADLIRSHWSGTISAQDLEDYLRAIIQDEKAMSIRRTLSDVREAEFQFTGAELGGLVKTILVPALKGKDWKVALLVRELVQYGVARQYQAYAFEILTGAIFTDEAAALAYLNHQV